MHVNYRRGQGQFSALTRWRDRQISELKWVPSPHGSLQTLELEVGPDANGIHFKLIFALPESVPLFLWKMQITNNGAQAVNIQRIGMLQTVFQISQTEKPINQAHHAAPRLAEPAFFSNGWGSWNHTGAFGADDRFRRTNLGPLTAPMRVNPGTPHPSKTGRFGSDMFGVLGDRKSRQALLAGFLSQLQHFGSLEAFLDSPTPSLGLWANGDGARLDAGESIRTDWACLNFLDVDAPDPLAPYIEAVSRQNAVSSEIGASHSPTAAGQASPAGWCSWYQYFQDISQEIIRQNLDRAASLKVELPLEVIQIDDGFETRPGDWYSFNKHFPGGLAHLAKEIQTAGFTPGLWLAPYILARDSRLAREHPDWLLRGKFNRPVNAGFIWNTFTTALDLTHPDALEHSAEVVHRAVHEMGFPYLKLDFLYAAALPGRYRDPKRTRAQVLRLGLERLREAAGKETFILGCGCPLGSAIGLVDAMRVGADVDIHWHPVQIGIKSIFRSEPDLPSARNAIQNALTRAPMHRRWWANDPDCLLLRPDTELSLAEVRSLATVIALSDGALFLSDDLPSLPPERLRIAKGLLPLLGERPRLMDWFDQATPRRLRMDLVGATGDWHLLALFNWDEVRKDIKLRLSDYDLAAGGEYMGREYWSGALYKINGGELTLKHLPAHGAALLALRHHTPESPAYLGGDLHISQGQEVSSWEWDSSGGELHFALERPGSARGQVDIFLPRPLKASYLAGQPIPWKALPGGVYRLAVAFDGQALIQIKL